MLPRTKQDTKCKWGVGPLLIYRLSPEQDGRSSQHFPQLPWYFAPFPLFKAAFCTGKPDSWREESSRNAGCRGTNVQLKGEFELQKQASNQKGVWTTEASTTTCHWTGEWQAGKQGGWSGAQEVKGLPLPQQPARGPGGTRWHSLPRAPKCLAPALSIYCNDVNKVSLSDTAACDPPGWLINSSEWIALLA